MNEQIKELMEQAFQEHYGIPTTPGARENAIDLVSGWGEKFAELIIKECAEIADCNWRNQCPGLYIKEHFGINND